MKYYLSLQDKNDLSDIEKLKVSALDAYRIFLSKKYDLHSSDTVFNMLNQLATNSDFDIYHYVHNNFGTVKIMETDNVKTDNTSVLGKVLPVSILLTPNANAQDIKEYIDKYYHSKIKPL